RLVGEPAAAEVGMDREAAEARDPAAAVLDVELHAPGEAPPVAVCDLDHEAAEVLRLGKRALDLRGDRLVVARAASGEERLDVVVVRELDEEVDVLGPRPPDAQAHRPGSTAARGAGRRSPEPTATPSRISARPPASAAVTGSPRKSAPERSAVGGRGSVTSDVRAGACIRSIRKRT